MQLHLEITTRERTLLEGALRLKLSEYHQIGHKTEDPQMRDIARHVYRELSELLDKVEAAEPI